MIFQEDSMILLRFELSVHFWETIMSGIGNIDFKIEGTWQRIDILGQIRMFVRFRIRGQTAASLCPVWAQITYLSWVNRIRGTVVDIRPLK